MLQKIHTSNTVGFLNWIDYSHSQTESNGYIHDT